jgi:PAS domain-containing protein
MTALTPTHAQLQTEIAVLQLRLGEATETLEAIRNGEVDAILGAEGNGVFTLTGADDPYRVLIEEMNQGAVTLAADGTILYCNRRFAELLQTPIDEIIGLSFSSFVLPAERTAFAGMLGAACDGGSFGEITLRGGDETAVPLQLALGCLPPEAAAAICLVATDIRESREKEARLRESMDALVAVNADRDRQMLERAKAEHATQQIMDNSLDVICIIDADGRFTTVSAACQKLWG